jgi:hypothetical protein
MIESQLVPSEAIAQAFMARQKVTSVFRGTTSRFDAVLQVHGGVVTLVGLSPLGVKSFVLRQTGREVEFEQFVGEPFAFSPQRILLDIHRVLFVPSPGGAGEGEVGFSRDGMTVRERWQGGKLMARRYLRGSQIAVEVGYTTGYIAGQRPPTVTVDNLEVGYRLTVETVSYVPL